MIQRIQTVYLLLTTFIAVLFLSGDIIFLNNGSSISLSGVGTSGEPGITERAWPLTALLVVIPVLSFLNIFLYKNRKLQLRLTVLLILLILAAAVILGYYTYYTYNLIDNREAELVFSYKLVLPLLMLIFSVLAYRGIKRDEEIVRSYDRLR